MWWRRIQMSRTAMTMQPMMTLVTTCCCKKKVTLPRFHAGCGSNTFQVTPVVSPLTMARPIVVQWVTNAPCHLCNSHKWSVWPMHLDGRSQHGSVSGSMAMGATRVKWGSGLPSEPIVDQMQEKVVDQCLNFVFRLQGDLVIFLVVLNAKSSLECCPTKAVTNCVLVLHKQKCLPWSEQMFAKLTQPVVKFSLVWASFCMDAWVCGVMKPLTTMRSFPFDHCLESNRFHVICVATVDRHVAVT